MQPTEDRHSYGILQILARHFRVACFTGLAVLALAGAYLHFTTRYYSSAVRLHVQQGGPRPIGSAEPQASADSNDAFLNTQKTIATSTPVLVLALSNPQVSGATCVSTSPSPMLYLKKQLKADVGKKDEILLLEFTCPDPQESAAVASGVAHAYVDYRTRQRRSGTEEMLKVLTKEQDACREQTQHIYGSLEELQTSGLVFTSEAIESQASALQRLKTSLNGTRSELASAEASLRDLVRSSPAAASAITHSEGRGSASELEIEQLKETILRLQLSLDQLRSTYGESHPRVETLREQLVRATVRYTTGLRQIEAGMSDTVRERDARAADVAQKAVQWSRMQSELRRLEQQGAALEARAAELRAQANAENANISVIEDARVPELASWPDVPRTLALAAVLAVICATVMSYLREWQAPRIESEGDVRRALGISVPGVLPRMPSWMSEANRAQTIRNDPLSDSACAMQALARALLPKIEQLQIKTLVVTAPEQGHGVTTVAANLALAFALQGSRVLLVDANFVASNLHVVFDAGANLGFGDELLSEQNGVAETISTGIKDLQIMLAGTVPDCIEERLNSTKMLWLLHALSERYDLVIFDTAAMALSEQARILASQCGGTILVARTGQTMRRALEQSYDKLLSVGARLVGVVVNGAAARAGDVFDATSRPNRARAVGVSLAAARHPGGDRQVTEPLRVSQA